MKFNTSISHLQSEIIKEKVIQPRCVELIVGNLVTDVVL